MKNELDASRSPEPDRVAVVQTALRDSLAVCKRTRGAAEIAQQINRSLGRDLRVITRDIWIVEHEVVLFVTPHTHGPRAKHAGVLFTIVPERNARLFAH